MDKRINAFILFLLLGLLSMYFYTFINNSAKYVQLADLQELKRAIERVSAENATKQDQIDSARSQITNYNEKIESGLTAEEIITDEIAIYKSASGFTRVAGEGVVVIVNDSERQPYEGQDPNELLVHDIDIQLLINDLMNAGAEALAVNGQRILFNVTDIYCNGPTIRINNRVYSQPFIIEAIGPRKYLEASVTAPDSHGNILKSYGLFVEANTSIYVEVPAYISSGEFDYAKERN